MDLNLSIEYTIACVSYEKRKWSVGIGQHHHTEVKCQSIGTELSTKVLFVITTEPGCTNHKVIVVKQHEKRKQRPFGFTFDQRHSTIVDLDFVVNASGIKAS